METGERFPQGLGNLAQDARFPHSHKPIILGLNEQTKNGRIDSVVWGGPNAYTAKRLTSLRSDHDAWSH